MVHQDISRPSARDGPSPDVAQAALDRILELFDRRKLMIAWLRYGDTIVKVDGAWYFAERNHYVDKTEIRPSLP